MPAGGYQANLRVLFPRGEHGAWATWLVPFFVALGVTGGWELKSAILLAAIFSLYVARYPLVLWARSRFKDLPIGGISTLLIAGGGGLLLGGLLIFRYHLWLLGLLGLTGLLLLFVHLWLVKQRQERTTAGEFLGIVTLTLSAPAAFYTATGSLSPVAFWLWFLGWLFFGGTIFFVKIQTARRSATDAGNSQSSRFARALVGYQIAALGIVILLSSLGYLPLFTVVAFVPLTVWMLTLTVKRPAQLSIKKLGFTLVGHSIAFGIILTLAFVL